MMSSTTSLLPSSNFSGSYTDAVDFRKGLQFVLDSHLSSHPPPQRQDYGSSSPDDEENDSFLPPPNYMLSPPPPDEQQFGHKAVKQEINKSQRRNHVPPQQQQAQFMFPNTPTMDLDNPKISSLVRHSSSPADFFSNFALDNNGLHFNGPPNTKNEAPLVMNFSSLGSRQPMPCIAETGDEGIGIRTSTRHFSSTESSWLENASLSGHKRPRESEENLFHAIQNVDSSDRPHALAHHLSLPANFGQMAAATEENILHFGGHVPCKIRAKRGFATHPRSIAERVRRSRISQKMRKLQDLFPDMDKQTSTADMLDMAVDYIKKLEKQVKGLAENKAKCSCPRQQTK